MERLSYYRYWGKAGEGGSCHLLPYHGLDVAAVGWVLMHPDSVLCQRLATDLGVKPEWLQRWFAYCLMLHGIGKFARAFQNLVPDLSPDLVSSNKRCVYWLRHDSLGYLLWKTRCAAKMKAHASDMALWMEVVCGHHGYPPARNPTNLKKHFMDEDITAVTDYIREVDAWWCPDSAPLAMLDQATLRMVSWQLAGVAVLADWLGSNQTIFTYCNEPMALAVYWENVALKSAAQAMDLVAWNGADVSPFTDIRDQFPFIERATPLQSYTSERPFWPR
jgi:CRISPR-associated endonuclease/helicase Cas3